MSRGVGRSILRLAGAVLVVALLLPFVPRLAMATGDSGRDRERCLAVCEIVEFICDIRCLIDCFEAFPRDRPARQACIAQCRARCDDENAECRERCDMIEPPPSPDNP